MLLRQFKSFVVSTSVCCLTFTKMVTRFERSGINFEPKVYSTFSFDGEEFLVQDLPLDQMDEAAEFLVEFYKKDETFQKAIDVPRDILKAFYKFVFKQKVGLVCYKKASNEMVGVNALSVKSKGVDTSFKNDNEMFRALRGAFMFINNFYDVFDHYNVNYYLYAHGLAVKTEYRSMGIATELLKARIPLLRELNLSVTSSLFTTSASQKAAINVGFHEDFSIPYGILQQKFQNFDFSNANSEDCKLLTLNIEL